jgi:hypothetical protein
MASEEYGAKIRGRLLGLAHNRRGRSVTVKIHTNPEVPMTTTAFTPLVGSLEELGAALRTYADEGISHVQLWIEPNTPAGIAALAPVLQWLDDG